RDHRGRQGPFRDLLDDDAALRRGQDGNLEMPTADVEADGCRSLAQRKAAQERGESDATAMGESGYESGKPILQRHRGKGRKNTCKRKRKSRNQRVPARTIHRQSATRGEVAIREGSCDGKAARQRIREAGRCRYASDPVTR